MQIAKYAHGRERVLKHVGSAHTEAELGVLLSRAQELLNDPAQGVLDLDVEPAPAVAVLSGPTQQPALFEAAQDSRSTRRDGPGRVISTDSRLLFQTLRSVYADLGFETVADEVFADLVVARIVEPTSLLDAGRVLEDLGRQAPSYSTMRRALARAHPKQVEDAEGKDGAGDTDSYRDLIAAKCFAHASTRGDISLVLYDVTTLYFEAEKEDDLRKVGFSKERRVDPQIVVGLLVDRFGFPLEIGCFEGNKAETHTIIPIVKAFQERHGIADMVVVADAGMLSATNLKDLDEAGGPNRPGPRTSTRSRGGRCGPTPPNELPATPRP